MSKLSDQAPKAPSSGRDTDAVKSLEKAVSILECFTTTDRALSVADIERKSGLPRSTAHRLAASLRELGFLEQSHERDRYRLGLRLFQIGQIALTNLDLHRESRAALDNLRRITNLPAHVAVFDGRHAIVVQQSSRTSDNYNHLTQLESAPAYCTSVGKAILAHQPDEVVERVISEGLVKFTDSTLAEPDALRKELREIRRRGYAVDDGEHQPGIRCVGAPILERGGIANAAVSVTSSTWDLPTSNIEEIAKVVIFHAAAIGKSSGLQTDP